MRSRSICKYELCRIGYVDYVLTEDMDTMVYGCPKLIRNCTDKTLKKEKRCLYIQLF